MNDNEPVCLLFERKRAVMRRAQERLRRLREDCVARRLGRRAPGDDGGISDRLAAALDDVAEGRVETHTVEEFLARLRSLGD